MNIAFITVGDTGRLTGGYLYHARVFGELRASGIDITEIVASDAPLAAQLGRADAFGAAFDPRLFDLVVIDALARAVCAPWVDGWRAQRPVVAMVHELPSIAGASDGERSLEAPLLRADRLIAVSADGRAILEARGVPRERIRIVSPGRDRLGLKEDGGKPQDESETSSLLPPSSLQALCVAQWIPRKDIRTLVEVWGSSPRPGAQLTLIGETTADADYAAQVQASIARARPDAPILVRGAVDDAALDAAYRAADLFVLPSVFEGYGMAYAEALSYGLPIIACAIGPLPDLIGAAGWLVPPNDPAALGTALHGMLHDRRLRERLARAARARAAALPTWQDTARGFAALLYEAVNVRA